MTDRSPRRSTAPRPKPLHYGVSLSAANRLDITITDLDELSSADVAAIDEWLALAAASIRRLAEARIAERAPLSPREPAA